MNSSEFIKAAEKLLIENGCKKVDKLNFTHVSPYGELEIKIDDMVKIGSSSVYTIFMRFKSINLDLFTRMFGDDNFNPHSFKWNINKFIASDTLGELETRFDGLTYPI